MSEFSAYDYVVFVSMLVTSLGIGIYFAIKTRKEESQGDYLHATRSLSILPLSVSILVSFLSAILILGFPAEVYLQGVEFWLISIGNIVGVSAAAFLLVPVFYPLQLTSVFEYLELRFESRAVRLLGTLLLVVTQVLYMGVATFAPSTALEAVTGFPEWATIVIIGTVATVYTSIGGMRAVVWTDVFQACVMLAGMLAVVIQGAIKVGGLETVWDISTKWKRTEFFTWDADPTVRHTVWGLVVGNSVQTMYVYGLNQPSVQRYTSLKTLGQAKASLLLNIIGLVTMISLACLMGIVLFAYYAMKQCDPLHNRLISNVNQYIPFFVMEILDYPCVPGLFISSLFAGALSSVSSGLNALAAVTWEDFLKPGLDLRLTEGGKTRLAKVLVLLYGVCAVGLAFVAKNMDGTVIQTTMSLIGASSGPITGLFLLGAFFPWANKWGAFTGGVTSFGLASWICIGRYVADVPVPYKRLPYPPQTCPHHDISTLAPSNVSLVTQNPISNSNTTMTIKTTQAPSQYSSDGWDTFYTISYMWYPLMSVIVVLLVGLIISFCTGAYSTHGVPAQYLNSHFSRLYSACCPDSVIRFFNCNRTLKIHKLKVEKDKENQEKSQEKTTKTTNNGKEWDNLGFEQDHDHVMLKHMTRL